MSTRLNLQKMAIAAKLASHELARASLDQKNSVLEGIMKGLQIHRKEVLKVNKEDIAQAKADGLNESMIDRLSLQGRLEGLIEDIDKVIRLPDPIGELFEFKKLPNHLEVAKCRTPIGVLGVIYESRPNVTIDISALSIKSGNCAILRGGSETLSTNKILAYVIQEALTKVKLPPDAIQLVPSTDRAHVKKLLTLHEYIDLIIPRGSETLHQFCRENSKIPVITGGIGICHLFVDETADLNRSLEVIDNAKTQRPTVCNALDTLLVHEKVAQKFIPKVIKLLREKNVSFRLDPISWKIMSEDKSGCDHAGPQDWDTEWLSLVLGIKVVKDLSEAMQHIVEHSTGHSDGILTQDKKHAELFVKEIDSAAVYVNASTRFTDGGQFGLGAEVAISTQKLHARGPMGLNELTSYKWIVKGDYSVRS